MSAFQELSVEGKVVVLTGASSGIGEATARRLVGSGAWVIGGGRRLELLESLASELGERFVPCRTDVTDERSVEALVALARQRFGHLDVAIANAAVAGGGTVVDGDPEQWRAMLMTNVFGSAVTLQQAARAMLERGRGHLVLMSSVIGTRVPPRRNHVYAATKWAVLALAEGLRQELAGTVRVTVVEPGFVDTRMSASDVALDADDVARTVLFAIAQPDEVALNRVQMRHVAQEL